LAAVQELRIRTINSSILYYYFGRCDLPRESRDFVECSGTFLLSMGVSSSSSP